MEQLWISLEAIFCLLLAWDLLMQKSAREFQEQKERGLEGRRSGEALLKRPLWLSGGLGVEAGKLTVEFFFVETELGEQGKIPPNLVVAWGGNSDPGKLALAHRDQAFAFVDSKGGGGGGCFGDDSQSFRDNFEGALVKIAVCGRVNA